jgi:murein L,D-transpeptidase YcbB/YkuD
MYLRNLIILSLLSCASILQAADENNQFAIKGIGLSTCESFVEARNAQSPRYFQFGGWINGYLSAINRYEEQTFDVAPWQSTGLLSGWLAQFCQRNPDVPFVRAVASMVNTLGKERITTRTELVKVEVGDVTVYIYESILRRVQERLLERGYYEVAATGNFNRRTQEAIERFQRKAGLHPTGLPDQPTLAKLLQ